jgi:hypothetical protein
MTWAKASLAMSSLYFRIPNQRRSIAVKKSLVMGRPEASPMTESIPHFGQIAVVPASHHWATKSGEYVAKQKKHPQSLL